MLKLKTTYVFRYLIILFIVVLCLTFIKELLFPRNHNLSLNTKRFRGIITKYNIDGDKLTLIVQNKDKLLINYYIKDERELKYLSKLLKEGMNISFEGELIVPPCNTIPNTFNYRKYLSSLDIYFIMRSSKYEIKSKKIPLRYAIKNNLIEYLEKFKSASYLKTFIIGDQRQLSNQTIDNYRILGISHLLAISGSHIVVLSLILNYVLKKIKLKELTISIILIMFFFFYIFLTNYAPSVLRAVLFFILLKINKHMNLKLKNLHLLFLLLIIVIFFNYKILLNIGFQYSYLTTLGLMLGQHILRKNYFYNLLIISIIAFLFSAPISMNNFYEINIFCILNNLFFVPLISFIVFPLSFLVLIMPFLDTLFLHIINIIENLVNMWTIFKLNIIIPKISIVWWIFYYLILYLIIQKNNYKYFLYLLIFMIIIIFSESFNPHTFVYFLDVGQGDCAVIRSAYNKEVIMIDTGEIVSFDSEPWKKKKEFFISDNVIQFLKSKGIRKINLLVLSHGDADHMGDAPHLIENFNVLKVMLNDGPINELERKITSNIVSDYQSKYLNIDFIKEDRYANENENTTIVYLKVNRLKFLFMGDASKTNELNLIKKYVLSADIIKLGHHGSKTSSDEQFLRVIGVREAIISSGISNRFNHPSPQTLDTLNKLNIKYYNTATNGTLTYKIE